MRARADRRRTRLRAFGVSLLLLLPVAGQPDTLEARLIAAETAMNAQDWERALKLHQQAVAEIATADALGPQFGVVHYRRGICEMKLKQWAAAMESFEICYQDFPNTAASTTQNPFEKLALLKWGEAALAAEEWALALNRFQKFMEERDKARDSFPQGAFHINSAIAHYRLGHLLEGSEHLEIAIHNKRNFPSPDSGIIAGFQELVRAAIPQRNERAVLDFIGKNRGGLVIAPFLMGHHSESFMKLAGDALSAEMPAVAEAIYQLVPATEVAMDDTKARIHALGAADELHDGGLRISREELEQSLAKLEAAKRGKNPPETIKLAASAYLHEARGNPHGAYAAYLQLAAYDVEPENRAKHLYHLARISALIELPEQTQNYAQRLIQEFPKFEKISEVQQLLFVAVQKIGTPAEGIAVALPMLETLRQGTPEHDKCLHFLGVSQLHAGDPESACNTLQRHQTLYPESSSSAACAFDLACAFARLGRWNEAAALLDQFLASHSAPNPHPLLPNALLERAACYLAAGDANAALNLLDKIISDHPSAAILGATYTLSGRAQQLAGDSAKAISAYQSALKLTVNQADPLLTEEALAALVQLHAAGKPSAKVLTYADRYWKEAGKNLSYQKKVALAQMHAYEKAGRGEEALERLRELIAQTLREPSAHEAAELVAAYAAAYLNKHSAEELQAHFESFPEASEAAAPGRALLRMEVINTFEKIAREAPEESRRKSAASAVKSLFQDFINQFQVAELPSSMLLRLGDHLRCNTSIPREALACYDELLRRNEPETRFSAMLGRGDVHARATSDEELAKGIRDFKQVYQESTKPDQQEYALFRVIELSVSKQNFAEGAALAGTYLERAGSGFTTFIPQVKLLLAACYQAQNLHDEAIGIYQKIWSSHRDELDVSGQAMLRWMPLVWERNRSSSAAEARADRDMAHELAREYLKATAAAGLEIPERVEIEQLAERYRSQSAPAKQVTPVE
jgi:tetratricopeptide (TPR) repeat protein